jgi:hypothetical protein
MLVASAPAELQAREKAKPPKGTRRRSAQEVYEQSSQQIHLSIDRMASAIVSMAPPQKQFLTDAFKTVEEFLKSCGVEKKEDVEKIQNTVLTLDDMMVVSVEDFITAGVSVMLAKRLTYRRNRYK